MPEVELRDAYLIPKSAVLIANPHGIRETIAVCRVHAVSALLILVVDRVPVGTYAWEQG